jgi:hypothetical protein
VADAIRCQLVLKLAAFADVPTLMMDRVAFPVLLAAVFLPVSVAEPSA